MQQRQHLMVGMIYILTVFFCHCLHPLYHFVLFILTGFYIVIIILLRCFVWMNVIYKEVKTFSEYSKSDNIRRYVTYIDLLFIFVSVWIHTIALFYLCWLFFLLLLLLYCDISVACIYIILNNITTQNYQKQFKVSVIYLSMVYSMVLAPLFLCLIYNQFFPSLLYLQLLFVTKISPPNFQQCHNKSSATSVKVWYGWYYLCVSLYQIFY